MSRALDLVSVADLGQSLPRLSLSFPPVGRADRLHRCASSLLLFFPGAGKDAFLCPVALPQPLAARSPAETQHRGRALGAPGEPKVWTRCEGPLRAAIRRQAPWRFGPARLGEGLTQTGTRPARVLLLACQRSWCRRGPGRRPRCTQPSPH